MTRSDLKIVHKAVCVAQTKWWHIGLQLGLNISDLDTIKASHHNIEKCFTEMLTLWLKQGYPPPTWSAVAAALRSPTVGEGWLAKQVQRKYLHVSDVTDSGRATKNQEGEFIG